MISISKTSQSYQTPSQCAQQPTCIVYGPQAVVPAPMVKCISSKSMPLSPFVMEISRICLPAPPLYSSSILKTPAPCEVSFKILSNACFSAPVESTRRVYSSPAFLPSKSRTSPRLPLSSSDLPTQPFCETVSWVICWMVSTPPAPLAFQSPAIYANRRVSTAVKTNATLYMDGSEVNIPYPSTSVS